MSNKIALAIIIIILIFASISVLFISKRSSVPGPLPLSSDVVRGSANISNNRSILGVGYAVADSEYARIYSQADIKWIKIADVRWQRIEPNPPRGRKHIYNWRQLDYLVKAYQDYGFDIVITLRAKSSWASEPILDPEAEKNGGGIATTPPKPEYWDDYANWIYAVAERYDKDGVEDMPGLKRPISYFQIESEVHHKGAWQGSVDDYLKLLEEAFFVIKTANNEAKVILAGINFGDIFDDFPNDSDIIKRFMFLKQKGNWGIESIARVLKEGKYDIVGFHYNRDYKGVYGIVEFIRKYTKKPIWADDATSAPWIVGIGEFNPLYEQKTALALFKKIIEGNNKVEDWHRAEQAKLSVKKVIAGAGAGVRRVFLETTNQWKFEPQQALFWKMWHIQNMVDKDKNPLPVVYDLKIIRKKIDGYSLARRLEFDDPNIYGYKFVVKGEPIYVFWYDDNVNQLPGEMEGRKVINLLPIIGKKEVKVMDIITEKGQSVPQIEIKSSERMVITEIPILVE